MKTELFEACDQVFFSGLSGLYQGVLVTLLVGLGLRVLSGTNAATRHAIWFVTLVLVSFLIPAHCVRDYLANRRAAPEAATPAPAATAVPAPLRAIQNSTGNEPSFAALSPVTLVETVESLEIPPWTPDLSESALLAGTPAVIPVSPEQTMDEQPLPVVGLPEPTQLQAASGPAPAASVPAGEEKARWQPGRMLEPVAWNVTHSAHVPRATSLALLAGCFAVGLVRVSLVLRRLGEIRKLKAKAAVGTPGMNELFARLLRQLGIKRDVQLKVTTLQRSPVMLGFLHPVVLIPADQPAEPEQLEPILRHELAHVRRRDDWANLAQQLAQAILFFHPAVWWMSRQLSIEREIACDDHVLQQGSRAKTYALLLATFASRFKVSRPLLAPGVSNSKSQLQKRIDMILNTKRNSSPRLAKTRLGVVTSAAALAAALAIYAAPRLVLAQPAPPAPRSPNRAPPALAAAGSVVAVAPAIPQPASPGVPAVEPTAEAGPMLELSHNYPLAVPPTPTPTPMPAPGALMLTPSPGQPPYIVGFPRVAQARAPKPPKQVDTTDADSSIEERLRRLEKMVESLVKTQERKERSADVFLWKPRPGEAWGDPEKLKRLQDMAQREADRAAEQAKRATVEAEKAMKLQQERAHSQLNNDLSGQMKALEKRRAALEREVEKLQGEIDRLQQQRDKLEEQQDKLKEDKRLRSELFEEPSDDDGDMALAELPEMGPPEPPVPSNGN